MLEACAVLLYKTLPEIIKIFLLGLNFLDTNKIKAALGSHTPIVGVAKNVVLRPIQREFQLKLAA